MKKTHRSMYRLWGLVALLFLVLGAPSWGTTLQRAGLETLVDGHETIVVGEVVHAYSYWNEDGSFILTDVTVVPERIFKGSAEKGSLTVTVMGGTVDDLTTMIVAGAELTVGESYLLFLNREDLKAGRSVMTVREHCQGVFEFALSDDGELRAISQAADIPLQADAAGKTDPPGGADGLNKGDIFQSIIELVARGAR